MAFLCWFSARTAACTACSGMDSLTSPASSMKRVLKSYSFAFQLRIEGVDRDAVPAEAGARIERVEAERLGGRRIDHLPDVHAHAQREQLQLVHQSDIHAAIDVFEQLGHSSATRVVETRTARVKMGFVHLRGQAIRRNLVVPADHLGNIVPRHGGDVPGSSRSGEKAT